MSDAADIIARIALEDKAFVSALNKAVKTSKEAGDKIEKALTLKGFSDAVGNAAKQLFTLRNAAVAAAGAGGVLLLANKAVDAAASLGDLSQQVGLTAEKIQVMRYAFQQNGAEIEQTDAGLKKFSKTVGDAINGIGGADKLFDFLQVEEKGRPLDAVLNDTIDALGRIEDPAQRASLAAQIFGKEAGPAMAKLIGEGAGAFKSYEDDLRNLGGLMSNEMVAKASEAKDKMSALKTVLENNFNIGLLQSYTDEFGNFAGMAKDPALAQSFKDIGVLVGYIAAGIVSAASALADLYIKAKDVWHFLGSDDQQTDFFLASQIDDLDKKIEDERALLPYAKDRATAEAKINALLRERRLLEGTVAHSVTVSKTVNQGTTTNPMIVPPPKSSPPPNTGIANPASVDKATSSVEKLGRVIENTDSKAEQLGETFNDIFADIVQGAIDGSLSLESLGSYAARLLQSIFKQSGTQDWLASGFSNMFSGAGDFLSGIFGGQRAAGGPVNSGMSYIVGENGPERLFMGQNSGYIAPAGASAGGNITVNQNIINNAGAEVATRERRQGGQIYLDVQIDRMVAAKVQDSGSYTGRARGFPTLKKR